MEFKSASLPKAGRQVLMVSLRLEVIRTHVSYSLNSFKGVIYRGLYGGLLIGVIQGDTRSLDHSSRGGCKTWGSLLASYDRD